jgi:predicted kinase
LGAVRNYADHRRAATVSCVTIVITPARGVPPRPSAGRLPCMTSPTAPRHEHAIFLITGISAAGKSTVAQTLAERLDRSVHLRGDMFRKMIVNGRVDMTPTPSQEALRQLHLRYDLAAAVADTYYAAGFTVVLQDVVLGPELPRLTAVIRGRPLLVVVLAPDAATVATRETARGKSGYGHWSIADLDDGFRRTTPRIGLWLDTSEQTVNQTVEEILRRAWTEARLP